MQPNLATCTNWPNIAFRLKPGKPSYQMAANNCWTFGWATNYNGISKINAKPIDRMRIYRKNLLTCFCLYLIASLRRSSVCRSPGSQMSEPGIGLKLSITSSSCEVREWSSNEVENSWTACLITWTKDFNKICNLIANDYFFTLYSVRNSVSMRLRRRSSHDNSKAVSMGSRELNAIKELADSAR